MPCLEERDLARWGQQARDWLTRDERGRTIGLVVLSLTISIAMSLMVMAIVGLVSRRRAAVPVDALKPDVGEPMAEVGAAPGGAVSGPAMASDGPSPEDDPGQAAGA